MSTKSDEIEEAIHKARLALLQRIAATDTASVAQRWAEAYAWVTAPGQAHGGATGS